MLIEITSAAGLTRCGQVCHLHTCCSSPRSPRRFWKQQQVRSPQLHGSERVLRRRRERLPEPTVLWPAALLHHPRPRQLRTRDHHRHQTAQVHVLLLPVLFARGEWSHWCVTLTLCGWNYRTQGGSGSWYCLHLTASNLTCIFETASIEDLTTNRTMFSDNPSLSWRCRLPPATQWGTLYSSGTRSPRNSSSPTNTASLCWRSTGPSVGGAAFQMLTLRWVYLNTEIH